MKKYKNIELEILEFDNIDIITSSNINTEISNDSTTGSSGSDQKDIIDVWNQD